MSETPLHTDLVSSLLSHLAVSEAVVTHVAGNPAYRDPREIGRHEPDVYVLLDSGLEIIGEAKTGPDLNDATSGEQLQDFSTHRSPNGELAVFSLCVPNGWRQSALEAIKHVKGDVHYRVDVLEVGGLLTAPKPPEQQ